MTEIIFKFGIGDEVKDNLTGFQGIVFTRTEFFNGCIRYTVKPRELDDKGERKADGHFDEEELALVAAGAVLPSRATAPAEEATRRPGGEGNPVPRTPEITR